MSKRIAFSLLLLALLLTPYSLLAQDDPPPEVTEYIVTGETVNLRAGPATSFEIIGQVNNGASVFAYANDQTDPEWLRLYREGQPDAYIASFLVRVAPQRFFPAEQPAEHTITGTGTLSSQFLTFASDAYRIDVSYNGTAFTLDAVAVEGECADRNLFDILTRTGGANIVSTWFVAGACTWRFDTRNTSETWTIAFRELFAEDAYNTMLQPVEAGTLIAGYGNALSMPTQLPSGTWQLTATVGSNAFILEALIVEGDCPPERVLFNVAQLGVSDLTLTTTYTVGVGGCAVYWHTSNVDEDWTLSFMPAVPADTSTE